MTDDDETTDLGGIVDDFRATLKELDEARDQLDKSYDAGHADGYAEGRRESDVTGHLLRPYAPHLLELLRPPFTCPQCVAARAVLEDLLR